MRPTFYPRLVNGRFGDPALYVRTLHGGGALLFDLGDLSALSARDLLRVGHVFVSHMHMDHFVGFDALLRVSVGRDKRIAMVGPEGFIAAVGHKLQAYSWDLVDRYDTDLVFDVTELLPAGCRCARFRFKTGFACEGRSRRSGDGAVAEEPGFAVRAEILEHHGASLGFALEEPAHVNVWRNRLCERGLPPGPWLQALKRAVAEGAPDDRTMALPEGGSAPLGALRDLVSVTPGQKLAYVTDVGDTPGNRARIAALAHGADLLFIEASFAAEDRERAAERAHLTTEAAGEIARAAEAKRVEAFHFSPRYESGEERLLGEVRAAFEAGFPPPFARPGVWRECRPASSAPSTTIPSGNGSTCSSWAAAAIAIRGCRSTSSTGSARRARRASSSTPGSATAIPSRG